MANTLKFGNGNWATKDGSTLAYNDESGFNPLPFDFTRASSATVVNKNGLIETVASGIPRIDFLGNTKGALLLEPARTNLIAQSQAFGSSYWAKSGASIQGDPSTAGAEQVVNGNFATDSDWTKGTGWTISGGKANASATTGQLYQATSTTVNTQYKIEYTISNYVSGTYNFLLRGGSTPAFSGNGTFTVYLTSGSGGNSNFIIDGVAAFTGSIDNVSIKEVQGFASPSADSPLGAFKMVEGSGNINHQIYTTATSVQSNEVYTLSLFAKKDERNIIQIGVGGAAFLEGSIYVNFDLTNGSIGSGNYLDAKIETLQNGWYKCSVSFTPTTTSNFTVTIQPKLASSSSRNQVYQGDGVSGVYIWGAQLEVGSYATSLINTSGSAVTRQADVCNNGANSEVINSTEGVLYVEIAALGDEGVRMIAISDGNLTNYVSVEYSVVTNLIRIRLGSGGVEYSFYQSTSYNYLQNHKIAISYKINDFKVYIDGVIVHTDTSSIMPIGLNVLNFSNDNGASNFYGKTKDLRVFTTALTDSELAALTTI